MIRKIDELKCSVENLSTGVKNIQLGSEHTLNKLQQVETGMADLDLPAYTGAMVDLAQNVNHVLHAMETKSIQDSQSQCDSLAVPPTLSDTSTTQKQNEVDKPRGVPGVLIITDMTMTSTHIKYVENQLELGKVTVKEVDPPWNWDNFEEMKYQLSHDISSSTVVMFNFSTMNTRDYNLDTVDDIVLLAKDVAQTNKVKVIISELPPGMWGSWVTHSTWSTMRSMSTSGTAWGSTRPTGLVLSWQPRAG